MYRWNSGVHQSMRSTSLIPVILRVYVDDDTICEVPITPESTWQDVVECCRDPGEELCHLVELWRGYERPVRDVERPFAVLQDWGAHRDEVFFCLRNTPPTQLDDNPSFPTAQTPNGPGGQQNSRQRSGKKNGMKEPTTVSDELPDGVELTLSELQEMATRQQQQIESQQQMLVVKEQRLKFLKQQESQHQQVSAESERLQRLREKMEAQETKLRKLRALWGQVDQQRMNNSNLTSELDTIRALFNEKEKELSVAVAKVDELTKQLEELRRGRANGTNMAGQRTSPAAVELEKLRRELLYHNKLNEQQNMKLAEQREALDQKQEEMLRIDKRIAELQQRLNKKRMLNQQLANQINAVSTTKPVASTTTSQPLPTATTTATTTCLAVGGMVQGRAVSRTVGNSSARVPGHAQGPAGRVPASGGVVSGVPVNLLHRPLAPNVAQVEPYQHTPKEAVVLPKEPSVSQPQDDLHAKLKEDSTLGFQPNKNDPKYQTLPYNTKFSVKFGKVEPVVQPVFAADGDDKLDKLVVVDEKPQVPSSEAGANGRNLTNGSKGTNSHLAPQTVHSTPAYTPARGQATAVLQMACTGVAASRVSGGGSQQQVASSTLVPQSTNGHRTSTQMIAAPGSRSQYDTGQRSAVASTAAAVTVTSAPSSAAPASVTNVAIMAPQLTQPLTHAQPLPALDPSVDLKVSSVAPEQKHNGNNKAGILYHQTSSTRVQPPIAHTFSTTPQGLLREVEELAASKSQGKESPPEPAIVETNSPESPNSPSNVPKPALPPKPNIPSKPTPPPRQLHSAVDTSPDAVDSAISILRGSGKQVGNIPFSPNDSPPAGLPKKSTNNVLDQYLKSMSQMYGRVGEPLTDGPNVQQQDSSVVVQDSSTDNISSQRKTHPNDLPIKPKPLTIKKNAALEPPKLKGASLTPPTASPSAPMSTAIITSSANGTVPTKTIAALHGNGNRSSGSSAATAGVHVSISRRIEMPPAFLFPENETQLAADANNSTAEQNDSNNNSSANNVNNNNGTDRSVNAKNLQLSCDVTDNLAAVHFGGVPEVDKTWDLATNKQKGGAKRPVVDGGPADMAINTQGPRTEGEGSCEPSSTGSHAYLEETSSQGVQSVDIVHAEQNVNSEVHHIIDQEGTVVEVNSNLENIPVEEQLSSHVANVVRRAKKGNLKTKGSVKNARRVSFDPLALLLDASLEGELELVKKTAKEVTNPSAANDEGITALHNAICAGHYEIVKFLVEFGCDVNAQDSDGWTPLHCAASCNNLPMVKFLVEHGACIFATTLSDQETAAEKCEEEEEGFDGCSEYLYSIQEKLGILNSGVVYALYNYDARNADELSFRDSEVMVVLRKGDDLEREWWWSKLKDREGYIPRNLLGLYPRVVPSND